MCCQDEKENHLQGSQRGDQLLLVAALLHLAPLLRGLAAAPVVARRCRQVVLHTRVLVVRARGPARAALHNRSWAVLVLLLRSWEEVDISFGNVSQDFGVLLKKVSQICRNILNWFSEDQFLAAEDPLPCNQ